MPREKGIFWHEYELVNDNSNEPKKYRCKHCNTKYAKNASRLQNHLEKYINYQKKLIEEELINTMSDDNSATRIQKKRRIQDELAYKYSESDQKELENLLAWAFYSAGMSFNIIENEDIKAVFQKGILWFKVPSRYRLSSTLLNQEYIKIKQLVESILNESEYFCITSDEWSSIYRLLVINYMITTPSPFFYKAIFTGEEQHTAINIARGIENIINEVGENRIATIITDNANVMKAAWKILRILFPQKWACQLIRSMKKVLNYFRNHQISLAILHRLQIEVYNKRISLLLPGDTRWGSVFYSAKNFLETKTAIQRMTLEDNIKISDEIKNKILSDNFWLNLKILCNFLSPFVIFLKKLQTGQPTLSTVYSELCKLKISISENTEVPDDFKTNSISKTLNSKKWNSIIEDELIRLVSSQDQENVLNEYADLFKGRYPILSEIALHILSIPPTSAACKRNWSTFGFIHNKLRNRLTDPKVEKCAYIQWNLRILRNLGQIDELNKNMDFVENLVIDNEDLKESVFDDLFSDNVYDENGCIDI
ncbi:32302_t:CDS:2, partial [Gigaspora margarita]